MSVSNRIDSSTGVNTTNNATGTSISIDANNKGFSPFQVDAVSARTASATLDASAAGVNTVSGSAGAITLVLPLASAVPGAEFIFRTTSADAHVLTGSQETAGTKVIVVSNSATNGSKFTFPAVVGSSVVLKCDGTKFILTANSGVYTVNGT